MKSSRWFILLSAVVYLYAGSLLPPIHGDTSKPNIIVIIADDLGWADVGYHGGKIATPNIDRLAKEGVQLNQFYVQPVCSPTRGAFMTGRYPSRLGLQCGVVRPWATHGLPLDERTIAQAMSDAGYETAIVGKWHLGHVETPYLPTRRGFEHQYGHYNGALDYFTHIRDGGHDWHLNDKRNDDKGYATDLIADHAVQRIAQRDTKRPLFLYVPFNAPHTPLQAPQKLIDKYKNLPGKQRPIYAAMVHSMDEGVGRILMAIDKHKMRMNTLVVFCSDNGGIPRLGSNGPLRAGKGTLYEGGVRVVAMMRWPGVLDSGRIFNQPMHIVDFKPTLVALAGGSIKSKKKLDGVNVWDAISKGEKLATRSILLNVSPFHGSVRRGDWKLIHNPQVSANQTKAAKVEKWELFNLAKDPSEKTDVKKTHPKIFAQLKTELDRFASEAVKPNIPPNQPPKGFKSPAVWGETD